jgi:hypothetical protein
MFVAALAAIMVTAPPAVATPPPDYGVSARSDDTSVNPVVATATINDDASIAFVANASAPIIAPVFRANLVFVGNFDLPRYATGADRFARLDLT